MSAYVEPTSTNYEEIFISLPNCSYRYDYENDMFVRKASLLIDGPITLLAAIFALIGAHFSIKFLRSAGLNRDLTAGNYFWKLIKSVILI